MRSLSQLASRKRQKRRWMKTVGGKSWNVRRAQRRRDTLLGSYVRYRICARTTLLSSRDIPSELVEVVRAHIALARLLKKMKKRETQNMSKDAKTDKSESVVYDELTSVSLAKKLWEMIHDLESGVRKPAEAEAISNAAGKITALAKLELQAQVLTGQRNPGKLVTMLGGISLPAPE